jgi:peptide/nickel transport system substrate-binding protein
VRKGLVLVLILSLALSVAAVTGCNKKSSGKTPKDTLVVAMAGDMENLDNQQSVGPMKNVLIQLTDWQWWGYKKVQLPNGLWTVDTSKIEPRLVTKWEEQALPDGRFKYTLYLRKDAKHYGSGNPVSAFDFVTNVQRRATFGRDSSERAEVQLYSLDKGATNIIDEKTVEFIARGPTIDNMFLHLGPQRNIVDWKTVLAKADKTKDPWGLEVLKRQMFASGPFMLESWTSGVEIVLKKNPDWWGKQIGEEVKLNKVVFRIVPSETDRVLLLKKGEVDMAFDLSPSSIVDLKTSKGVKVLDFPSTYQYYVGMNQNVKPFDNVKLRQAMSYAFPYKEVIDKVFMGLAQRLPGPLPKGIRTALDAPPYDTDLVKAKQLLKEAGYEKGLDLTLYLDANYPAMEQASILFQAKLKEIGVNVTIQKLAAAEFSKAMRDGKTGFFFDQSLWWVQEPSFLLRNSFKSDIHTNYARYKNARVDQLLVDRLKEPSAEKRDVMYKEIVQIVAQEAPWIFVAQPNFMLPMRDNVQGYVYQNTQLHHLWLLYKQTTK